MFNLHATNIALHVGAGSIALSFGFAILLKKKGTLAHRRLGRLFCYASFGVCTSAAIGLTVFKFLPLFAATLLLVLYQVISGWRLVRTQADGPSQLDGVWTTINAAAALLLAAWVWKNSHLNNAGCYGTLGALALVLTYDACRRLFPRRWYGVLWCYEHVYKMVSSLFGMLSALVGSVLFVSFTWSPVLVTVIGQVLVLWLLYRLYASRVRRETTNSRA